jgi:hypothetical protein
MWHILDTFWSVLHKQNPKANATANSVAFLLNTETVLPTHNCLIFYVMAASATTSVIVKTEIPTIPHPLLIGRVLI